MAPDVRDRMFGPFYTTRSVRKGTERALTVAYSIAQKHGGRFEVDSAPGCGTSVHPWLPIGDSDTAESLTALERLWAPRITRCL